MSARHQIWPSCYSYIRLLVVPREDQQGLAGTVVVAKLLKTDHLAMPIVGSDSPSFSLGSILPLSGLGTLLLRTFASFLSLAFAPFGPIDSFGLGIPPSRPWQAALARK